MNPNRVTQYFNPGPWIPVSNGDLSISKYFSNPSLTAYFSTHHRVYTIMNQFMNNLWWTLLFLYLTESIHSYLNCDFVWTVLAVLIKLWSFNNPHFKESLKQFSTSVKSSYNKSVITKLMQHFLIYIMPVDPYKCPQLQYTL